MANLTIRGQSFHSSNSKSMETIRSCLNQMNRVEEINLNGISGSTLEEIFRDVPKSAPQLHTLCIGAGGNSFHYSGTGFSIHEDFLYNTERLQRVELIRCKISWDAGFLTGLTCLTLEDSLNANSSIIQVLHALQRMPALTDLHLKDSIPDDSKGLSTSPVVDLPCLRVLNISSGVGPLTAVLHHITFPHSAILNLTCKEKQSAQMDFSDFFSVLSAKFLSSLVIRSLSLRVPDGAYSSGLEFYLWTTSFMDCFPYTTSQSQLQLVLSWPSSHHHNHEKTVTCAFNAMSLPFLTQLQISNAGYVYSQTWVKTFGRLPLLEQVCLRGNSPHSFLEALIYKKKAAEKSKSAYRAVSFPKLRHIHLDNVNFDQDLTPTIDILIDCLMERYERKAEVQVLRLDDCYCVTFDDVERLEEIVVDVIWDEVEQGFTDEEDEEDEEEYDSDGNLIDSDYSGYDDFPMGAYW